MIVLGIDPSLNSTGWAIVEYINNTFSLIAYGEIIPPDRLSTYTEKIRNIAEKINSVCEENKLNSVGMEETIVNVNPSSSLKLGMVRGSIITICSLKNLPIKEYLPKKIKLSVTGVGSAGKDQISFMVSKLISNYPNNSIKSNDVTDAIATAITHLLHSRQE